MEGKRAGGSIFLLALMWLTTAGSYLNSGNKYLFDNAYWIALVDILIVSLIMMFVPLIARIIKKEKLEYKHGKRLCLWNSIILFIISVVMMALFDWGLIGGLGTVSFYFINKWTFVKDKYDENQDLIGENSEEEKTDMSLSCNKEIRKEYGTYNIYGSDIALAQPETVPEKVPIKDTEFIPEPTKTPELAQTPVLERDKTKYCSKCGNRIDNATKQCTGCGKQYFKGINFIHTLFSILVILLICAVGGLFYYRSIADTMNSKITRLQNNNSSLLDDVKSLEADISNLNEKIVSLEGELDVCYQEINFYNEFVVFVEDDGTNYYHNFHCYKFKGDYFWTYNVDAAKAEGYKPCPNCCK